MDKENIAQIFEMRAKKIKKKKNENGKVFLTKQRMELLKNVNGSVLEVAVGRGNNFQFYPEGSEVVAVDFSPTLLEMAEESAIHNNLKVKLLNSDVEKLNFEENSFDTIVSTLTLCSYDNPIEVLNNFNRWCKPTGQILLLEHGISSNQFYGKLVNRVLNKMDDWCMKNMGDHINRNIPNIIKESDIKIYKVKTILMDTHYLIWAKPLKNKAVE